MVKRLLPHSLSSAPDTAKDGLANSRTIVSFVMLYGTAFAFLCVVVLISLVEPEVDIGTLSRDTAATLGGHQLTGLVSNVGILLWAVAASICLFSYTIYRKLQCAYPLAQFFLGFGLFTTVLLADDLFMLHERDSDFHIPEKLLFAFYFGFLLLMLRRFRQRFFQKQAILFWLSLLFFGLSIAIDVPNYTISIKGMVFVEDSFKFLGIISWTGFLVNISFQSLVATFCREPESNLS